MVGSLSAADLAPTFPLWDSSESVADYAKKVNLPLTQTLDLGNGVKLDLVLIPAGTFIMGTPTPEKPIVGKTMVGISGVALFVVMLLILFRALKKGTRLQFSIGLLLLIVIAASIGVGGWIRWNAALLMQNNPEEHPAHPVTLTHPYYMGKFVVTKEQFGRVFATGYKDKENPIEDISWEDAQSFCEELTKRTRYSIRLPTEAEWEYACRAGTNTTYHSGNSEFDLARVAWYSGNSKDTTHPVGQKEPNAFGLYDMHGNVWQWCQDWYAEDYYEKSKAADPQGSEQRPDVVENRSLRGGAFYSGPQNCRSARRHKSYPFFRYAEPGLGFRVVMVPALKTP